MCGIFALLTSQKCEFALSAANAMQHRGPNERGEKLVRTKDKKYIYFLHYRLSVLDLSMRGNQPMEDAQSGATLIYNGELYNYLSLKKELEENGFSFSTDTDTEVVLKSYLQWGPDCVNRFNGMFAFAIWDAEKQTIFVARDRFGEKPLFYGYSSSKEHMLIASEMKSILDHPQFVADPDFEILENYLKYGKSVTSYHETPFKNIHQLTPASWMIISSGGEIIKKSRYWRPLYNGNSKVKNANDLVSEFSYLLEKSVLDRTRCDVQVGACLSGGLDSTSITGYLFKNRPQNFSSTISVRFDNDITISESGYLDEATKRFSGLHYMITPTPEDFLTDIESIHWHHEMPLPSASMFLEWSVMKKAKAVGNTVMLDGQGADELLGGYPYYFRHYQKELVASKKFGSLFYNTYLFRKYLKKEAKKYMDSGRRVPMNSSLSEQELLMLIIKEMMKKFLNKSPIFNDAHANQNLFFSNLIQEGLSNTVLQEQLHSADRNGMAFGIETRFPFLDYDLVDFCLNLPLDLLIKNGMQKYILRKAAEKIIPAKIYNRKDKIGFLAPQDRWLAGPMREWCFEKIFNSSLKNLSFYNSHMIKASFDNLRNKPNFTDAGIVWRHASLSQWMQTFKVQA